MQKEYLLTLLLFTYTNIIFSQYNFGERSYGGNLHLGKNYNPAILPEYDFHFNLVVPFPYFNSSINIPTKLNNFLKNLSGKTIIDLKDISNAILSSSSNARSTLDLTVNVIDIGIRTKDNYYYNFGLNFKTISLFDIDKDLIDMIPLLGLGLEGVDRTYNIDKTNFRFASYGELFLGFSTKYKENYTFGGRLKFLYGMAGSGKLDNAYVTQYSKDYSLDINANYSAFLPQGLESAGMGMALDFGFTYKLLIEDRPIIIGASIIDLGFIANKGKKYSLSNENPVKLEGVKINDILNMDFELVLKDLENKLKGENISMNYFTLLSSSLNISGDWEFSDNNHTGINCIARVYGSHITLASNVYYSFIGKYGGVSPSVNLYNKHPYFGLSGFFKFSGLNLFAGTDNIVSFNFKNTNAINLYFGLSLSIKHQENKPQPQSLKEEQLNKIKESKNKFKKSNPLL